MTIKRSLPLIFLLSAFSFCSCKPTVEVTDEIPADNDTRTETAEIPAPAAPPKKAASPEPETRHHVDLSNVHFDIAADLNNDINRKNNGETIEPRPEMPREMLGFGHDTRAPQPATNRLPYKCIMTSGGFKQSISGEDSDLKKFFTPQRLKEIYCMGREMSMDIECFQTASRESNDPLPNGYAQKVHLDCPKDDSLPVLHHYSCKLTNSDRPNVQSSMTGTHANLEELFSDAGLTKTYCTRLKRDRIGNSYDVDCIETTDNYEPLAGGYARKTHIDCPAPTPLDTTAPGSGVIGITACETDFMKTKEELGLSMRRSKIINLQETRFSRADLTDKLNSEFCGDISFRRMKFIVTCKRFRAYGDPTIDEQLHFLINCP